MTLAMLVSGKTFRFMKLNESETKTIIVLRSQLFSSTIGRTVRKEYDVVDILGVTFESKTTFEKNLRASHTFQSSFSNAWNLEKILASI